MIKILVTGSDGRFGKILKKFKSKKNFVFKNKKELNILSIALSKNVLKRTNLTTYYI